MGGPLYRKPRSGTTRWTSFENPTGARGAGGKANRGAKGHSTEPLSPGESKVLCDVEGCGLINRIWLTVIDRSPLMLRSLRIDMYWDGAEEPAVSAPLGDFFGVGLGRTAAFEGELFASPEGRSFISYVPMPFRSRARIAVTNESDRLLSHMAYDVNYTLLDRHDDRDLYFHAFWHRENPTQLGRDFEVLPRVHGAGRYLGANFGVMPDPAYGCWWGEGEVKVYLDGDRDLPTLVGTGTEDYIGTAWEQGLFCQRFVGCTVCDGEPEQYCFYRYHIPDPVFFDTDCRVTIQQMGGALKTHVIELMERGLPVLPVATDGPEPGDAVNLLERPGPVDLTDPDLPGKYVNFYRGDDWSAAAYFYLDKPTNGLLELQPVEERVRGLP